LTPNIHDIWKHVCRGDATAWRELVETYAGLVNSVARRVGLSIPDSEDCAQQTWLTLYRKRESIRDPQSLPAWLIRTTHRQAIHMAQRLNHRAELSEVETGADNLSLPDELVQQLEHKAILEKGMEQLDTRCRQLLTALFLEKDEVSYSRMASVLGLKPNSVGSMRTRCLKKLENILKKMGYTRD
jgi:RNA polymerase sigma factor (sigma-70 family)